MEQNTVLAIIVIILLIAATHYYVQNCTENLNINFTTFIKDPRDVETIKAALGLKMKRLIADHIVIGVLGGYYVLRGSLDVSNVCIIIPEVYRGDSSGPSNKVNIAVFNKKKTSAYILNSELKPITGVKDNKIVVGTSYKLWPVKTVKPEKTILPQKFKQFMTTGPTASLYDIVSGTKSLSASNFDGITSGILYKTLYGFNNVRNVVIYKVELSKTNYANVFFVRHGSRRDTAIVHNDKVYIASDFNKMVAGTWLADVDPKNILPGLGFQVQIL